jgi:hypothetical protein
MARRSLLNEQWWHQTISMPDDEREIIKHYTLDQEDLFLIGRQNRDHNRLGLACVLACLRHPGRPLGDRETPLEDVVRYLAGQIGVDHREIQTYFERPQTRREHIAMLLDRLRARPFSPADIKGLTGWLTPAAQSMRRADILADMVLDEAPAHSFAVTRCLGGHYSRRDPARHPDCPPRSCKWSSQTRRIAWRAFWLCVKAHL